jgi:hypothetical protein
MISSKLLISLFCALCQLNIFLASSRSSQPIFAMNELGVHQDVVVAQFRFCGSEE